MSANQELKIEQMPAYNFEIIAQKMERQLAITEEIYAKLRGLNTQNSSADNKIILNQLQSLQNIVIKLDEQKKILDEICTKVSSTTQVDGNNKTSVWQAWLGSIDATKSATKGTFSKGITEASNGNTLAAIEEFGVAAIGVFAIYELGIRKLKSVGTILEGLFKTIGLGGFVEKIKGVSEKLFQYMSSGFAGSINKLWDTLKGGASKAGNVAKGGWNIAKDGAQIGLSATKGGAQAGWNMMKGGVQTGWKMTTEFGGKALGSMMNYSKNLLQLAKSVNLLSGAQKALNLVMRMSPIGAIILAVGLLIENWDKVKAVLDSVWAKFQETFPGLAKIVETYVGYIIAFWTQLPDNIMAALGSVYEIITGAFSSAFDWLSQKFSWIQGAWSSLFGGGNKASEAPGDVYSNARGGIVMHPILTTFAEEGPEAAIPLDGSSRAVSLWYTAGRMLGMFEGQQQPGLGAALPAFGGDSANQGIVVSAPINITINGNADSNTVQQVQQAAQAALMDLKRQLKEMQWQERRVSFG